MKTKAKYVIVILFLCTIPLYFCRMIGWKDDAIRLYDVILYGMESQEGDSFVGGMIWKLMQESVFENINAWLIIRMEVKAVRQRRQHKVCVRCSIGEDAGLHRDAAAFRDGIQFRQ